VSAAEGRDAVPEDAVSGGAASSGPASGSAGGVASGGPASGSVGGAASGDAGAPGAPTPGDAVAARRAGSGVDAVPPGALDHTPYVADPPRRVPSAAELRERIPGWGSDLDPGDRPSVPKLSREVGATSGAHWDLPDQQPGAEGRERSIEHAHVTPVFGTAQPLSGPAGVVRRYAYRRFSEGRLAHWMLLVLGDRIDVATHRVTDALRGRPDRVVHETGVRAELRHHPVASRAGSSRRDWRHGLLDPVVANWGWLAALGGVVLLVRRVRRR